MMYVASSTNSNIDTINNNINRNDNMLIMTMLTVEKIVYVVSVLAVSLRLVRSLSSTTVEQSQPVAR